MKFFFSQLKVDIILIPELVFIGLSSLLCELNLVETELGHNSEGGLISWVLFEMGELAKSSINVHCECWGIDQVNKLGEVISIFS